jgi:hypothetical protein
MVKILYNDCYGGGFQFSPAFVAEITRRTGGKVDATNAWRLLGGAESLRCNPAVLALFEEKGAEWSSGPECSLALREVPDIFAGYWEVEECEGNEYVRVLITDALADMLEAYMASPRTEVDHALLVGQYARIQAAREALDRSVEELKSGAAAAGGGS